MAGRKEDDRREQCGVSVCTSFGLPFFRRRVAKRNLFAIRGKR